MTDNTRHWVSIYEPDDPDDHWVITGDLRSPHSGWSETNYEYEDAIKTILPADLRTRIEFDSEECQFFAYAHSAEDAVAVADVAELLGGTRPVGVS